MLPAIGQNHPQSGNYAPLDSHLWADATYPLGAHYRGDSGTFAVYSK
ncbi:MAG: glycoside hydrolase family 13, partial [Microcystis aeruginosa]